MKKRILITGGAGFIGSHLTKHLLNRYPDYELIVLDALTYSGNCANFSLDVWDNPHFVFWKGNILDKEVVSNLLKNVHMVVHLAARNREAHVLPLVVGGGRNE